MKKTRKPGAIDEEHDHESRESDFPVRLKRIVVSSLPKVRPEKTQETKNPIYFWNSQNRVHKGEEFGIESPIERRASSIGPEDCGAFPEGSALKCKNRDYFCISRKLSDFGNFVQKLVVLNHFSLINQANMLRFGVQLPNKTKKRPYF